MHLRSFGNQKYNNGFTLAEVLITLVIIGIIAAMTVPSVINTYVESSTVSKVKKCLSVLGQAKMLAEAQNGPITDWDYPAGESATAAAQLWAYLRPHIQVAKDCGSDTSCYQANPTYYLSGAAAPQNHASANRYYKFVFADGGVVWFRTVAGKCTTLDLAVSDACAVFFYDVNGDKAPNTMGRDIFLYVMNRNNVYPALASDCSKNSTGWGCSNYIMKKGNMKYLH